MKVFSSLICSALLLGASSPASAQAENRLGLFVGFPTSAGLQWQINERFAVRGDAAFSLNRVDQVTGSLSIGGPAAGLTTTATTRSRSSVAAAGLSTLFTLSRKEQLRLYLAPRIAWQRVHAEFSTDTTSLFGGTASTVSTRSTSSTRNGIQFDGMFGANYRLANRFSIYGEAGLSLTTPTASSSSETDSVTSYSFGSRSGVGVVIHF